ncbi:hypothetical protein NDU88_003677 [Pleurodeles waltl]|uniref:Uncharacterized protein n=1 Tax=Pleurodeles waltl TaxID=8319 RepID=A0AAV7SGN3_PLEWA|nr:hypothetical protein NDU88_003677 [Pleurodeles waltl]
MEVSVGRGLHVDLVNARGRAVRPEDYKMREGAGYVKRAVGWSSVLGGALCGGHEEKREDRPLNEASTVQEIGDWDYFRTGLKECVVCNADQSL